MANEIKKKKPSNAKTTSSKTALKKSSVSTAKKPSSAIKKPAPKKSTTTSKAKAVPKKSNVSAAKKTSTAIKKPAPKKSTTTSKAKVVPKTIKTKTPGVSMAQKTTSTIRKPGPKKTVSKADTRKKPKIAAVSAAQKTNKPVRKLAPRKEANLKTPLDRKTVKSDSNVEQEKKGKLFYLVFAVLFYAGAFFYINNILYNNNDYIESALFAFAALFVVFILIEFNIHMILVNFFRLPFKYLIDQSRLEIKKTTGHAKSKGIKSKSRRYRAIFTLTLYILIILLLVGSQIYNGIIDEDKFTVIFTQSLLSMFVFLVIICSWQYLFNILPGVLDKSIDAKNGFILTLSAAGMIIFVAFYLFDITYLSELMIFVLIVGFIALLGVNLNMIVGEINIFQNIKSKKNKAVTKAVFLIFFSFHAYVILYASVVAFSIYRWEPETFNFSNDVCYSENIIGLNEYTGDHVFESIPCEHGYGDFLYYTVVSVSTLGYGDITPSLDYSISQAWGAFLSFYGFTFFALSIGLVSNIAIEGIISREDD